MSDFSIPEGKLLRLHGRTWRSGQEDALEEAGFPKAAKAAKARTGAIEWKGFEDYRVERGEVKLSKAAAQKRAAAAAGAAATQSTT